MPSRRDIRAGDPVDRLRAGDWNRLVAELEGLGNLTVTAPLRLQEGPGGRALTLVAPPGFYARLSGSASPYSFSEVYPALDGTFPTLTGGRAGTANAYEVNAGAGLASKVEWLIPGAPGDYRFAHVAKGTVTPPPTCTIVIHVQDRATGAGIAGAAVTIKQGTTVRAAGTTNSSGNYVATNPPSALTPGLTYTATVTYDDQLSSQSVFCGGTFNFAYCKASVTLTTEPDSLATFGSLTLSPPPMEDLGGGVYRWTYRELRPLSIASYLPATALIAASKDGYVPRCQDVTVGCGDSIDVALPLFHFEPDYFVPNCACPATPCQNLEDAPDYAGVSPKTLHVRWSVVYAVDPGGPAAPGPLGYTSATFFGSDAGAWIPLTWDGVAGNGANPSLGSNWDSGCRAGNGVTIQCSFGGPATRPSASTRLKVTCNAGAATYDASYVNYPGAGCTNTSPDCTAGFLVTGERGVGDSGLCAPVGGSAARLITNGSTGSYNWSYYALCEIVE